MFVWFPLEMIIVSKQYTTNISFWSWSNFVFHAHLNIKDDNLERTILIRNISFNDVVIIIVVMSKIDVIIKFCFIIMFQEKVSSTSIISCFCKCNICSSWYYVEIQPNYCVCWTLLKYAKKIANERICAKLVFCIYAILQPLSIFGLVSCNFLKNQTSHN